MPKSTTEQLARAKRLRLTLFASLGLLPLACGGTVTSHNAGDGGDSGSGGSSSVGGHHSSAGATSIAGDYVGGFPTTGGSSIIIGGNGESGTGVVIGGAGGAASKIACTSSKLDPTTGLVICTEGYTHRPVAITCGSLDGAPTEGGAGGADSSSLPRVTGYVPCEGDPTACAPFQYGYCSPGQGGPTCVSGCATDQDCGPGAICLCTDPASPTGGSCIGSSCGTDKDCQPGYTCASYSAGCGGGYACQTPKDACKGQADCKAFEVCEPQEDGHRACMGAAVCGRPFLVADEARVAAVVASGAWHARAQTSPRVDHSTSVERTALAEHWTRMGQMEHASIAAFARFSLQLLALGAPPKLVEACTRALGDETAHTKLCFELASAYAGRALGPGPLDVRQSLELTALEDIVELVIAEGCLGETGAALDALDAAERATDPVIRRAYSRIARDEARHAELAFQFVRWALGQNTPAVRERVASVTATLRGAASAAAQQVTLPCLEALLA